MQTAAATAERKRTLAVVTQAARELSAHQYDLAQRRIAAGTREAHLFPAPGKCRQAARRCRILRERALPSTRSDSIPRIRFRVATRPQLSVELEGRDASARLEGRDRAGAAGAAAAATGCRRRSRRRYAFVFLTSVRHATSQLSAHDGEAATRFRVTRN